MIDAEPIAPPAHRFKPGHSGNPSGRPKGARGFARKCRDLLKKKDEKTTLNPLDMLWHVAMSPESKNWPAAMQILIGRGFGKELNLVELSGPGGAPVQVQTEVVDGNRIAAILTFLERTGALHSALGPRSALAAGEPEADPVHPTHANGAAGGVPPAELP